MTVRRTSFAIAVAAFICASPVLAQEPAAPQSRDTATRVAVPRASRARAERDDAGTGEVRAPRRVERERGSQETATHTRARAPVPEAPAVAKASEEQQGGARRRPGGSSASGGGRPSGGSGRPNGGGGRSGQAAGQAVPRQGGVRSPDVNGGGYASQRYARAVPRSYASRNVVVSPYYGRRYYHGSSGFGYYYYNPWSWYAGYGWPGYYAGYGWPGYYGSLGYYGSVGVYGPYGGAYYGGGYGGYGAYGGPYGYSIGGVRLRVNPKDAEVYVDGYYAGIVDDFDGTWQQLRLDDGAYRIEIRKPGLATLTFDVQIQPGRTITYRGDMLGPP